jgi:alpha-D-ribose 1-methylphosphonate 5-triphosphate synthase subunit PhnG
MKQVVHMKDGPTPDLPRKRWMGLLATAREGRVAQLLDATMERPAFTWLRPPEIGSVMVQGRAGGTGAPFNLGEMTVTRCTLRLASGTVGHAYVQGRRKTCAEVAALIDALMQTDAAPDLERDVLAHLEAEKTETRGTRAAKAAATKVEFFTLVRGED